MKNMKRVLALVLVFALSFTMMAFSATAFTDVATSTTGNANSIDPLNALGIFKGYEDGTFKPDQTLTREQFAAIAYRLLTGDVSTGTLKAPTKFPDVKADRWSSGFVAFATEAKPEVIKGYTDGTFKPDSKLTAAEMGTMLVRVLGYEVTALSDGAARAFKLGLIDSAVVNTTPATRGMAADAVYAALNAKYLRDMLDGEKVADQPTLGVAIFKVKIEEDAVVLGFIKNEKDYNFGLFLSDETTTDGDLEHDNPVSLVGNKVNVVYKVKKVTDTIKDATSYVSITKADGNVEASGKFADFDVDNVVKAGLQTKFNTFKLKDKTFKYNSTKDNAESNSRVILYIGDQYIETEVYADDIENIFMGSKADGTLTITDCDDDGIADFFKVSDFTFLANIKSMSKLTKEVTINKVDGAKTLIGNNKTLNDFNAAFDNILGDFTSTNYVLKTTGDDKLLDLGTITEAQITAAKGDLDVLIKLGTDGLYHATIPTTVVGKVTELVANKVKTVQLDAKDYPMMNEDYLKTYGGVGTEGDPFWKDLDNLGSEFTATLNASGAVIKLEEGSNAVKAAQGNYGIITAVDSDRVNIASGTDIGSADWTVRIEVMTSAGTKKVYNTTLTTASGTGYDALIAAKEAEDVIDLDYEDLMNSKDKFDVAELENAKTAANTVENTAVVTLTGLYKYTPATLKLTNIDTPISSPIYTLKDGLTSIFYVVKSTDADGDEVISVTAKTPSTLAAFKEEIGVDEQQVSFDKVKVARIVTITEDGKTFVEQLVVVVDNTKASSTADFRLGFFSEASVITEDGKKVQIYKMNEINDAGEKVLVTYKSTSTAVFPTIDAEKTEDYLLNLLMYKVNSDGKITMFYGPQFTDHAFQGYAANTDDKAGESYNLNKVAIDNNWANADATNSYIKFADGKVAKIATDAKMYAISMVYDSVNGIKSVGDITKVTDVNTIINLDNEDTANGVNGTYEYAFVSYTVDTDPNTEEDVEITAIYFVEDIAFGRTLEA